VPILAGRSGRLDAVDPWHADVHEDDIGAQPLGQAHGLLPVGRLADDLDIRRGLQQDPYAGPHQTLVVHDQCTNHAASPFGSSTLTDHPYPPSGRGDVAECGGRHRAVGTGVDSDPGRAGRQRHR
jgi:hypothetical protein